MTEWQVAIETLSDSEPDDDPLERGWALMDSLAGYSPAVSASSRSWGVTITVEAPTAVEAAGVAVDVATGAARRVGFDELPLGEVHVLAGVLAYADDAG